MSNLKTITPETLPVLAHQGVRVITTDLLARVYGTDANNIQMNFANNADRFESGKHYFKLEGEALRDFKHRPKNFGSVRIAPNVKAIMLWTERGAARHAKMLNTDQAWDVFERMEDVYFRAKDFAERHPEPAAPISAEGTVTIPVGKYRGLINGSFAAMRPPGQDTPSQDKQVEVGWACLRSLLEMSIQVWNPGGFWSDSTAANLIRTVSRFEGIGHDRRVARLQLGEHGLRVEDGYLLVANNNRRLLEWIGFRGPWGNVWGRYLSTLPGAYKWPKSVKIGNQRTSCVKVPLLLIEHLTLNTDAPALPR